MKPQRIASFLFHLLPLTCCAFLGPSFSKNSATKSTLFAKKQSKSTEQSPAVATLLEEEETPAGVAGAEIFGGNREKEEFYDASAELNADQVLAPADEVFDRFADASAFPSDFCRDVAMSLQTQINNALYEGEPEGTGYSYSSNLVWETPLSVDASSRSPCDELEKALDFYNRVDAAVISAQELDSSTVEVQWEVSVTWPNFWEAHVLLTGSSRLTIEGKLIVEQKDTLDNKEVLGTIGPQVIPRFWDAYHIGMSSSAEMMPRLTCDAKKGVFSRYSLFELPPRLVLRPSMLDIGSREQGYAQVIPNHAFSTVIKTMGPKRQRYIATSPVEIQIARSSDSNKPRLTWTIPLAVELLSSTRLPIAGEDSETSSEARADVKYEYQTRRRVATVPFGGFVQDVKVAEVRKALYEQVTKDGHKPKLENGRPVFFFLQNDAKACFTEEGLGMAVYDWRPNFVKTNEVGIELELE